MTDSLFNYQNKPTVSLCTLGCKVNQYESQAISEELERLGFFISDFDRKCDAYIINTCTVTGESDKKSRQMIRRARKNGGKNAVVVAVGCFSQAQKNSISKITELDAAFGNADKSKVAETVNSMVSAKKSSLKQEFYFENRVSDISCETEYDNMSITKSERTRAFVKIVDGCENKCSYCIIPSVRGKIRSRTPEAIEAELSELSKSGYKEVVLTGIETAAYGKDLGINLNDILKLSDKTEGIERIRLGSLEPTVVDENFINTLKSMKHAVPHFHLSLQSGSDAVLRGMRRKYNTKKFLQIIENMRQNIPCATFTTDIIVGFPGETDDMFKETCEFVKKCKFLFVHIFPYSMRSGTDAAAMSNQIPDTVKKSRAAYLKQIMLETRASVLNGFDGFETDVLFEESDGEGFFMGHTPNYIEAKLANKCSRNLSGTIQKCKLKFSSQTTDFMLCELI